MAGHHAYHTKSIRLVVLLVLACLAVGPVLLVRLHHKRVQVNSAQHDRIHGRWREVRTSLGLAPLTRAALPPASVSLILSDGRASRFDLGSKRRAEEATRRLPLLDFTPDTRATFLARYNKEKETDHLPGPA